MKDFKGRTAFVTGGASGIGLGMARAFGRAGMNVVIADIDTIAAKAAVEGLAAEQIKAVAVLVDVTDRASVESAALDAVAAFGKIHVVCNNAGIGVGGLIGGVKERDWDWLIDVNLKGVVYGTETFVPLIRSHGEGGHIVNTASLAGMFTAPGMEAYSATKFAVVAMSEGWAMQLGPQNIGVSVLCPGLVSTRIYDGARTRQDKYGGKVESDAGKAMFQAGIDPDIVGARVLEGVKAGELYIISHPNFRSIVERRLDAIRAAFDAADRSEVLKQVKVWPPTGEAARNN
ncbi:MAG TPA: SDR family NAD(P)-dependent oxidoreductase [Rhizomicrobium sp.]|jgi:NAD(P)-dependent dehydrogenase (short-subunit alcohol dehydrogenase family)|nr:SDR family NAD(P)-dependent oxidoreductase [Rhizomicrobium sp.]